MKASDFKSLIERNGIKKGDILFLRWVGYDNSKPSCVSRLNEIIEDEKGISIRFGYLVSPWNIEAFVKIRKSNLFDKILRPYWGNSLDNSPF